MHTTHTHTSDNVVLEHVVYSPVLAPLAASTQCHANVISNTREAVLALVCARSCGMLDAQTYKKQIHTLSQLQSNLANGESYQLVSRASHATNPYVVLEFLFDTGSSAHITNNMSNYVPGSVRQCNVSVCGISKDNQLHPMRATTCGDVVYRVSKSKSVVIRDVLYLPSAVLSASDNTEGTVTVLVSGAKFVSECNLGLHFVAGGEVVEFTDPDRSVVGTFISHAPGLYVDNNLNNNNNNILDRESVLHQCASTMLRAMRNSVKTEKNKTKRTKSESEQNKTKSEIDKYTESKSDVKREQNKTKSEIDTENEKKNTYNDTNVDRYKEKIDRRRKAKENSKRKMQKMRKNNKEKQSVQKKSKLSVKQRAKLAELLHKRMHFGKTQPTIDALKRAYGDDVANLCDDEWDACDACNWAKAKFKPCPKSSHRKATRIGERLHFDVFTSPWRSDTGCKYLLVVVDEYSSYVWAFGMRKKSQTMNMMQILMRQIEKKMRQKVDFVDCIVKEDKENGIEMLRCDNAGENILKEMRGWCAERGTKIETTIPHTPYQNGLAERVGGVVWKGGASFRYGGNLPNEEWLRCCLAYVHVRNRLPSRGGPTTKLTPYEIFNDIEISQGELLDHLRVIGCLCFVTIPLNTRVGKPKLSYRAVMLGYSDHAGQKGYVVRNLSTGKIEAAAYNQVRFYEHKFVYPPSPDYDEWLKKSIKRRDNGIVMPNLRHSESDASDEGSCEEISSSASESDSTSDNESEESDDDHEYEPNDYKYKKRDVTDMSDIEEISEFEEEGKYTNTEKNSSIKDVNKSNELKYENDDIENEDMDNLRRMEMGEAAGPPPLSPYQMRSCLSDESRLSSSPALPASTECAGDVEDCQESSGSDDTGKDRYEVDSIKAYRRVGRKRNRREYLTVWVGGETTWEPPQSFKIDNSTYLDVYNDFKKLVDANEVSEYDETRDASVDWGENAPGLGQEESQSATAASGNNSTLDEDAMMAIAKRINVLSLIVKSGIEVPANRKRALDSSYWPQFAEAEREEIRAFNELDVWELVPKPRDANVVGTRWVYDVKVDEHGNVSRYKARLVAQGFSQKQGIDFTETFAPTMHIKTARVLLSLAARHGLEVLQYDVSTAFLHASLKETVYVKQPPGHVEKGKENWVYRLNKAMYGLKNAPKAYSDHFMSVLASLGFKQSSKDECLWTLKRGSSFIHYLFHVDDILCVSNDNSLRDVMFVALERVLRIRNEGPVKLFLGMVINREDDGSFTLSQKQYIEKLAETFCVTPDTKPVDTPAALNHKLTLDMLPKTEEEKKNAAKLPYRELVGSLIYVTKTRPDVAYDVSDVARFMSDWGKEHFTAALRILKYLYATRDRTLLISPNSEPISLSVYCDANYGDDRDSGEEINDKWKSQGGYLMLLNNNLVSWRSRRHKSRCYSSMEAEYMEASEAAKEVLWFRALLMDLGYEFTKPTLIYEDNKACIAFSKNNTSHDRTKHIDIRAYALRDHVRDGHIEVVHVETKHQLADMLTKTQLKKTFLQHRDKIFAGETTPPQYMKGGACKSMCACLSCFVGGAEVVVSEE